MAGTTAGSARTSIAWLGALFALLVALAAYANYRHKSQVSFTVQSSGTAQMQVFHDAEGRFAEGRSRWLDVAPGARQPVVIRVRGQGATRLRLDPPTDAVTTVCDIQAGRSGTPAQFEILHVSELALKTQGHCLRLQADAGAGDPQVVLGFVDETAHGMRKTTSWKWVLIAALLALVPVTWRIGTLPGFVPAVQSLPVLPGFGAFQRWAHWACAALMLVFGLAYIAVTPPGAVADEEAHLSSVIHISQYLGPAESGRQRMPDPRAMYGPFSNYTHNKDPFTREQLVGQLRRPLVCEAGQTGIESRSSGYFPHHYLLAAATFKIGCAAGTSFGGFLYAARILNLLLATALVAFGVACASRGKLGLVLIALLPMSLFQMSSLSADSLVFALGIAWLGVISGIASGTLRPRRAAAALWGLSLAIAFLKPGAAWILVSLLFCKPAYDAARESFNAAVGKFLVLPWTIHLALTLSSSEGAQAFAGVDAAANLQSLSSDPLGFLHTVVMTFYDRGQLLWQSMVGVLGWLDVALSRHSYWAATLMFVAAAFANGEPALRRPKYVVPLALLAIAGSVLLMALPLFIYWTPAGSQNILGLQGRYFTMTAAFALVWCGVRSPRPVQALSAAFVLPGLLVINADALYQLYDAYFVAGR